MHVAAMIDPDPRTTSSAVSEPHTIPCFPSIEQCLAASNSGSFHLDAASVCVPTSEHASVAAPLLVAGVDLLIEKPMALSLDEADLLIRLARDHHRVLQVGHLERFNPAVIAMRTRVSRPMFFEAHRLSLFSPRSLDVDVVLDLMIHDLDVVLSLVGSPVRELHAVGLPIVSSTADIASVRLEFESGCVANFTASRVSTERVRKLRLFQPHQYISVDYARQDMLVIAVAPATAHASVADPSDQQGRLPPGLVLEKPAVTPGEPLRLEIEAFLQCVRDRSTPIVTGEDGRKALALALEIYRAMEAHQRRAGLEGYGIGLVP